MVFNRLNYGPVYLCAGKYINKAVEEFCKGSGATLCVGQGRKSRFKQTFHDSLRRVQIEYTRK